MIAVASSWLVPWKDASNSSSLSNNCNSFSFTLLNKVSRFLDVPISFSMFIAFTLCFRLLMSPGKSNHSKMVLSSCAKRPHLKNFSVTHWKTGTTTHLRDKRSWHKVTFAVFSNFSWRNHLKSETRRSSTAGKSIAVSSQGEKKDISFIVTEFTNSIVWWPSENGHLCRIPRFTEKLNSKSDCSVYGHLIRGVKLVFNHTTIPEYHEMTPLSFFSGKLNHYVSKTAFEE